MFKSYYLDLFFDCAKIISVPQNIQLERFLEFLISLRKIDPIFKNWYLCGDSREDALRFNVMKSAAYLPDAISKDLELERTQIILWNGEEDVTKGGINLICNASSLYTTSGIEIEDAGTLVLITDRPDKLVIEIFKAALKIWPEIVWGMVAPEQYYLYQWVFPERRSIGWIGFCPHELNAQDFPQVEELISLPGRGTIVVSRSQAMDETNREHFQRVGEIDIKLMELGYLSLFSQQ